MFEEQFTLHKVRCLRKIANIRKYDVYGKVQIRIPSIVPKNFRQINNLWVLILPQKKPTFFIMLIRYLNDKNFLFHFISLYIPQIKVLCLDVRYISLNLFL